jgi:hypothetical protein
MLTRCDGLPLQFKNVKRTVATKPEQKNTRRANGNKEFRVIIWFSYKVSNMELIDEAGYRNLN